MKKQTMIMKRIPRAAATLLIILLSFSGTTCLRNDLYKNASDETNLLNNLFLFGLFAPGYSNYSQWTVDGQINAMVSDSNSLYIGGTFNYVQPNCRYGAILDPTTGYYPSGRQVNPINGSVYAAAPDGAGGWYIGGSFSQVGNVTRYNLARINADGTLSAWNPPQIIGAVRAIALYGNTVYAGGDFTIVDAVTQNYIAAFDSSTGAHIDTWNPNIDPPGGVNAIIVHNGNVIFGGGFNTFNSGADLRNNIAAADASTGTLTPWNPDADDSVYTLAADSNAIYAGGNFTLIGVDSRQFVGAINPVTGAATSWNPDAGNPVNALAVSGGTVYVGGSFTTIGGTARNYIAAVDTLGAVIPLWDAKIFTGSDVRTIAVINNAVYFGGSFTSLDSGAAFRNNAAAVDTATGALLSWDPNADNTVNALSYGGTALYAGGDFWAISRIPRMNAAAFDIASGYPRSWDPKVTGTVNAMALSGSTLYVGGNFTNIGAAPRSCAGAIDTSNGAATAWDPNVAGGQVNSIAIDGNIIYIGGNFTQVGTGGGVVNRNRMAALDASININNYTTWDPNIIMPAGSYVNAIVINGNTVYAGGSFSQVGLTPVIRNNIASFDKTIATDNYTSWDPNANGEIRSLSLYGNIIYAAGGYTNIGGQARPGLAALDTTIPVNNATPWNPAPNANVNHATLSPAGDILYAGGMFMAMGGQSRMRIGAVYTAVDTNNATPWNPIINTSMVNRVFVTPAGDRIYAAGDFQDVNGYVVWKFAALDAAGNLVK